MVLLKMFTNLNEKNQIELSTENKSSIEEFLKNHQEKMANFENERKNKLKKFDQEQKSNWIVLKPTLKSQIIPEQHADLSAQIKVTKMIREKMVEWGLNTTSHGIPNIIRLESKLLKLIWLMCFLASLGYCVFTIVSIILTYLEFDVLINQQVVTQTPIDFPAVTVCNLNPFDRRKAQNFIDKTLLKNNISYVTDINLIDINPKLVNTLIKSSIVGNKTFTPEQIEYLGFDLNYMLLTCYFNDVQCSQRDFIWRYDFDYGNCYTFNSGYDQMGNEVPVKQINEAGSDQSLKLELFLGYDQTQSQYILNSGARVVVHNQSVHPIMSSEGIDISTGFKTNIGVKRSFLYKMDSPYSDCIKNTKSINGYNSFYYKSIFNVLNMTQYRQKICLRLCLQDYIFKNCKCLDGSLPIIYKENAICDSIVKLKCVSDTRISYFSDQESNKCVECPLECDSSNYQLTTSSSRYPTRYYQFYLGAHTNISQKFPPNTAQSEYTKGIAMVNVYYDDLATTYTIELPAVTPTALLGNIGGNLGLFIGISLLTFVEVVELLLELIFILFKRIKIF